MIETENPSGLFGGHGLEAHFANHVVNRFHSAWTPRVKVTRQYRRAPVLQNGIFNLLQLRAKKFPSHEVDSMHVHYEQRFIASFQLVCGQQGHFRRLGQGLGMRRSEIFRSKCLRARACHHSRK